MRSDRIYTGQKLKIWGNVAQNQQQKNRKILILGQVMKKSTFSKKKAQNIINLRFTPKDEHFQNGHVTNCHLVRPIILKIS